MDLPGLNMTHYYKGGEHDNTTTFIIGLVVLMLFVLVGILASVFLCMTVKKDMYLWEVDRLRQLEEKENEGNGNEVSKGGERESRAKEDGDV